MLTTAMSVLSWLYTPFRWVACLMCGIGKKPTLELQQQSRTQGWGGFQVNLFGVVHNTAVNIGGSQIASQSTEEREDESNA